MKPKVVVTWNPSFPVAEPVVHTFLGQEAQVRFQEVPFRALSERELAEVTRQFENVVALLVRPGIINASFLDRCPALRHIAVHGAGVDQIDVGAATDRGVIVTNAPGANTPAVAEYTIGLLLSLIRRIPQAVTAVRAGEWDAARAQGAELNGKVLALVGLGAAGRAVGQLAAGLGMKVVGYDPAVTQSEAAQHGITWKPYPEVLDAAQFVSIHVPLLPETRHLVNAQAIRRLSPGAFLVSTARGGVVDESALPDALDSGQLQGIALDVLEDEPPRERGQLFDHPDVIITPHMAGSSSEALERVAAINCRDIADVLRGQRPEHIVNVEAWEVTK